MPHPSSRRREAVWVRLELLGDRRHRGFAVMTAGEITDAVRAEFGISQPAVSQHLRVLRQSGFASVTVDGQRRLYAVKGGAFREVDEWLGRYRQFWTGRLDALDTEVKRGKRSRRPRRA